MSDELDTILDVCLSEVVGRKSPPDLSARILRKWEQSMPSAADELLPPVCESQRAGMPIGAMVERKPTSHGGARRTRTRQDRSVIFIAAATMAVGLCVLITTFGVLWQRDRQRRQMAEQPAGGKVAAQVESPAAPSPAANGGGVDLPGLPSAPQPSPEREPGTSVVAAPHPTSPTRSPAKAPVPASPAASPSTSLADHHPLPSSVISGAPVPEPMADDAVVTLVNESLRAEWNRVGASVPEEIAADAWLERTFTVLLGRAPTSAERGRFPVGNPAARAELVRELMQGESYVEEFARRWSDLLASVYLPREGAGAGEADLREGMLHYLRRALIEGRSWDRVVTELLTATGTGKPGTENYNGASSFLLARTGGKLELATADTARLFLGREVTCLACHDNLEGKAGEQREFWELNSFFRQLAVERNPQTQLDQLKDVDFLGEDRRDGANAVVFFETPGGLLKSAYPAWSSVAELPKSGMVSDVNRREWLARCVTSSAEFRQATVNQLWELVFGLGLAPQTDLNAASEPTRRMLDTLGDQWASRAFDPRPLLVWMLRSEAFSVPGVDAAGTALLASPTLRFQGFASRPPPDFRRAWQLVTKEPTPPAGPLNARVVNEPVPAPASAAANDAMLRVNGSLKMDEVTRRMLASGKLTARQKGEHLFWSVLHRPPRRAEWELIEPLLAKAENAPDKIWEQVWSALQSAADGAPAK